MANQKWTKWVVGISSVAVFTTFLQLTKNPTTGTNTNEALLANNDGIDTSILTNSSVTTPLSYVSGKKVGIFIHTREEMQQLQKLDPTAKSERERLLESLDWDNLPGGEITLPPQPTQVTQLQPTPVTRPKSDRKTRRS